MNYLTFFLLIVIGIALLASPAFDENIEQGSMQQPTISVAHNKDH